MTTTEVTNDAAAGAECPPDRVGEPQDRLAAAVAMLERERGLSGTHMSDRALVVPVVLPALDRESLHVPRLEHSNDVAETSISRSELADALMARARHDLYPNR